MQLFYKMRKMDALSGIWENYECDLVLDFKIILTVVMCLLGTN